MKFMLCPQCGIAALYVMNESGERLSVRVTRELEIVPKDESASLDGFDTSILYCLGCSWKGKVGELKKFLV